MRIESVNIGANKASFYTATVSLEELSVRGGLLVQSENRTHRYTAYRRILNPEIPRLRFLLQIARRDLERLMRDFHHQGHTRHVTNRVQCSKCRGKGTIKGRPCARCKGTGKHNRPTSRGKKRTTVQHPRRHGHVNAPRVTMRQIERKRAQVRHLRHRLAIAPTTVTERFFAEWPYVIHHYEKTGVIQAGIRITSNVPGATPEVITARRTFRQADATVDNPNPRIGLNSDPLILASDYEARTSLIRSGGSEVAVRIIAAVLRTQASKVRAKAENASRRGNSIDATEAYVDLVHLVKPYDSGQAARLLERLRRQRR